MRGNGQNIMYQKKRNAPPSLDNSAPSYLHENPKTQINLHLTIHLMDKMIEKGELPRLWKDFHFSLQKELNKILLHPYLRQEELQEEISRNVILGKCCSTCYGSSMSNWQNVHEGVSDNNRNQGFINGQKSIQKELDKRLQDKTKEENKAEEKIGATGLNHEVEQYGALYHACDAVEQGMYYAKEKHLNLQNLFHAHYHPLSLKADVEECIKNILQEELGDFNKLNSLTQKEQHKLLKKIHKKLVQKRKEENQVLNDLTGN